jgi:hypothetical protein
MVDKIWTAEELERMTPAELDELFESHLVSDLDGVPPEFLDRVRARARERERISEAETPGR